MNSESRRSEKLNSGRGIPDNEVGGLSFLDGTGYVIEQQRPGGVDRLGPDNAPCDTAVSCTWLVNLVFPAQPG